MIPFRSPLFSALDSVSFGDRLHMQAGADIAPLIVNWGSNLVDVGADSLTGSVISVGPVNLRDRANVNGSLETAATATKSSGVTITGTSVEHASLQLPAAPTISVAWPTSSQAGFSVNAGASASRTAGSYGSVVVNSNGTLNLAAGTYFLASLVLEADAIVVVAPGVTIHLRDGLIVRGQFRNAAGAVAQVSILYRGAAGAVVEREFHGSILAPSAQLTLGANVPVVFAGQFLAKQLVVRTDVTAISETLADGGIFPPTTPAGILFKGDARIVVQQPGAASGFRWIVESATTGGTLDSGVGASLSVKANGTSPWSLRAEQKDSHGVWVAMSIKTGSSVRNGDFLIDYVLPSDGTGFVLRVERMDAVSIEVPYSVSGKVTWSDGKPFTGTVKVYDKDLRNDQILASCVTDSTGAYSVQFSQTQFQTAEYKGPDLYIVAIDDPTSTKAPESWRISDIQYNAPTSLGIDLVLSGRSVFSLSEFEELDMRIQPLLNGLPPEQLVDPEDVQFLTNELGEADYKVRAYVLAWRFKASLSGIPAMAFYGWIREGMPSQLPLLRSKSKDELVEALKKAHAEHIVDMSRYGSDFDGLANQAIHLLQDNAAAVLVSNLSKSLPSLNLNVDQIGKIATLSAQSGNDTASFWRNLASDPSFKGYPVPRIQMRLALHQICDGNVNLAGFLMSALDSNATDTAGLAKIQYSTLRSMVYDSGVVRRIDGETDLGHDSRVAAYAANLQRVIEYAHPKDVLIEKLRSDSLALAMDLGGQLLDANRQLDPRKPLPSDAELVRPASMTTEGFQKAKSQLESLRNHLTAYPFPLDGGTPEARRTFLVNTVVQTAQSGGTFRSPICTPIATALQAASNLKFGQQKIDKYLIDNPGILDSVPPGFRTDTAKAIRAFARLYAIIPRYDIVVKLFERGYRSAGDIARLSEDKFMEIFGREGFGDVMAISIHRTARKIAQASSNLFGMMQSVRNGLSMFGLGSQKMSNDQGAPSWSSLFERPSSVIVPEWQSVLSPAAYFVELLHYLETAPVVDGRAQPFDALIARRPDLVHIQLDREGTFDEISHSQLVLEILEAYVARQDSWTPAAWESVDWDSIHATSDQKLSESVYPFEQPVDLVGFECDRLLSKVDLSRADLSSLLVSDSDPVGKRVLTRSTLGLAALQSDILTEALDYSTISASVRLKAIWGLRSDQELTDVRTVVEMVLDRAQITLIELEEYSRSGFANGEVNLQYGRDGVLEDVRFAPALGLSALHQINRFFRLLKELRQLEPSRSVHQLDAALRVAAPSRVIDEDSLWSLARIVRLCDKAKLAWFSALETLADIDTAPEWWLGTDGAMEKLPSRFERVFRQTGENADPDFAIDPSTGGLSKQNLLLSSKANVIAGAFGIDTKELSALESALAIDAGAAGSFSLRNLSDLWRLNSFCQSLDVAAQDLILGARLIGYTAAAVRQKPERFLTDWATLAKLGVPWSVLRYLYSNSIDGEDAIRPISLQAKVLKDALVAGFAEIESGLQGMVLPKDPLAGSSTADPLEPIRLARKTELVGTILGDALSAPPATIVDLLSNRIASSKSNSTAKAIDDVFACGTDSVSFNSTLIRLQKAFLFTDSLSLSTPELVSLCGSKTSWQGVDLSQFSDKLDGTENVNAIAWFAPLLRYVDFRQSLPKQPVGAPSVLDVLKGGLGTEGQWNSVCTIAGWTRAEIDGVKAALSPDAASLSNADFLHMAGPAIKVLRKLGKSASVVSGWVHGVGAITEIREAVKARFDEANWNAAYAKLLVELRNFRRERMVEYVLNHCSIPATIKTPDQLYQWFLIDVKMDAGQTTSRIVQATATVQQFVQRCLLNLESDQIIASDAPTLPNQYFPAVSPASFDKNRWSWMKNYRVWEANRRVFLYPENYLEPSLRPDKSEFFQELEQELMESAITTENVEKVFHGYLQKLDQVARIKIVAQCTDPVNSDFHVFGRTEDLPGVHYHRVRSKEGVWTGWRKVPVEIPSEHLAPVFYNRRLYLYWIEFAEKADTPDDGVLSTNGAPVNASKPQKHWEVSLSWSEFQHGKWSAKKMSTPESGSTDSPTEGTGLRLDGISWQPFEYHLLVENPTSSADSSIFGNISGSAYQQWGRNPTSLLRLRLMAARHSKGKLARQVFGITHAVKSKKSAVRAGDPKAARYQNAETSNLSEIGRWAISRPGGFLSATQGASSDSLPIVTYSNWLNDAMSWRVEGPLSFRTPAGWDDWNFVGDYDEGDVQVLAKTAGCNLLFAPNDQDLSFQPDWKPFFFMDSERSYLVSTRRWKERRTLTPDYAHVLGTDFLNDLNRIDPRLAMLVFQYDVYGASSYNGYGYSNYSYGYGYNELWSLGQFGSFQREIQTARMKFEPHYHPYSGDLLAHLVAEGVEGVLNVQAQDVNDGGAVFLQSYQPTALVTDVGAPKEEFDFSTDGAYSLYNWEIYFHIPMLIAAKYVQEKNFTEARRWFHFVFDPTTTEIDKAQDHLRFWKFRPLNEVSETQRVTDLLAVLDASSTDDNAELRERVVRQINYSVKNPFEPHGIARLRLGAYQKSVFMKYLDNIMEWADQLYSTDTREAINEATQLYVLASDLLGPAPERMPRETAESRDYAFLRDRMDEFGNALVGVEDWITDVRFGTDPVFDTYGSDADAATLSGAGVTTYFSIPDNEKLADYWSRVDDRLYKIRHGLDINGTARSLSLFSPRLDPANLVAGAAVSGGLDADSTFLDSPVPPYRFTTSLQKAMEFCNEVKSFGGALLSALEKKDSETLGLKRSQYEIAVLQMTRKIREEQINDAEIALEVLRKSRSNAQFRRDHYNSITKVNSNENLQMTLLDVSAGEQLVAQGIQIVSAAVTAVPDVTIGCSGFGGSPHVVASGGGAKLGSAMQAMSTAHSMLASISSHFANRASILASRERREEEWSFQATTAQLEMDQLDVQIKGARSRIKTAKAELASQELQIRNSQAVESFLKSKFTNDQLYGWMANQISGLYFKAYQLAYQLAKQAEACFLFERREKPTSGISFGSWDGLRKGLLAGEKLAMDLRRLEVDYLKANTRDPEITKNISLVSLDPSALIALKTTGSCKFTLPEALFDLDHPGHFFRKVKSVAVTVPSVTGPYSGIHGKLSLTKNSIRYIDAADYPAGDLRQGPNPVGPIFLSNGQNDTGMFETNLRDERYLPFEGCGVANSEWELKIPIESNSFDLDTISDVVLRIQYTAAISSKESFASKALEAATAAMSASPTKVVSIRYEHSDAWQAWRQNPTSRILNFALTQDRFPLGCRGKKIAIGKVEVIMADPSKASSVWKDTAVTLNDDGSESLESSALYGELPSATIAKTINVTDATSLNLEFESKDKSGLEDIILLVHYSVTKSSR